jgi:uncharacterized protein
MNEFSKRKSFPGETGNPIDVLLHKTSDFEQIPTGLFFIILFLIAFIPAFWDWRKSAFLFIFITLDWLLFSSLPRFNKSFGPFKISVFLLAILRLILTALPLGFNLGLNVIGFLLVFWGVWVEPHRIKTTYQELSSAKLPAGFKLRLLHLADLHLERITAREIQLLQLIKDLSPDLILFSGDFLNLSYLKDAKALEDLHEVLKQWQTPLGAYAVTGSPAVDLPELVPYLTEGTGVKLLDNETVNIQTPNGEIRLTGITCRHRPNLDGPVLESMIENQSEKFNILLYHTPDLSPVAANLGVDLQLSGHTHGGQVRIPVIGAVVTGSLFGKRYESGRYKIQNMVLYVSRGLGMEGLGAPRARLFCPPEVILWEISGSKK